jgi:1L-myo-inositol 1-phosphate cytidylyltransferase
MKSRISEAVILMAGSGSRLRGADETFLKPLAPIEGRPLVSYTIEALARARIERITAVIGFQGEHLGAAVKKLIPHGIKLELIENREWQKQNGISVLAAKSHVNGPFLLTMSDHVFDASIVDLLIRSADLLSLNVAIDRKLNSIFDLADAMKLQTREGRVFAIGKDLAQYDAIDIGLFACPLEIFDYLERAKSDTNDCSLADGVRAMAGDGKARAIDIGDAWWQDVDTPEMLSHAERHLRTGREPAISTRAQS